MSVIEQGHLYIKKAYRVVRLSVRFFMKDGCTYSASALTVTSLLSIVPLMFVSFTVLSAFPVSRQFTSTIQDFIFENFVAASGKVIQTYLQGFATHVTNLSAVGVLFLLFTAVLMLFTIEQTMNKIWRVRERRHGLSAMLMYWAVLTLLPLLMGIALALTSYIASFPYLSTTIADLGLITGLLNWLPFILTFLALLVLYVAIPNCRVNLAHGAIGAITATILLKIAKDLVALYFSRFETYELLYGAFAAIPFFLIWLYTVWLIVLFGAELAHACSALHVRRGGIKLDEFSQAYSWLRHLYKAQQQGRGLTLQEIIQQDSYDYAIEPAIQMNALIEAKLVQSTTEYKYVLGCDLSQMSLLEVYQALPWQLPSEKLVSRYKGPQWKELSKVLKSVDEKLPSLAGMPIATLFKTKS